MKRLILIGLLVHAAGPWRPIGFPQPVGQARLSCRLLLAQVGQASRLSRGLLLNLLGPTDCWAADSQRPKRPLPNTESLLPNGDFQRTDPQDPAKPAGWDKPDGLGVQWTNPPGRPGKAIRLDTAVSEQAMVAQWKKMGITQWDIPNPAGNAVSDTYGLSYYSDAIPVKSGQVYRVTFDYMGPSGGAKVWVRGWGLFAGEKRRRWETFVNCRTQGNDWTHFEQDFHPTKFRPGVSEMKVMLFAYYPPGIYWFANVKIEPVDEPATPPSNHLHYE